MNTHPLRPGYRMVLVMIARAIGEGLSEADVNKTQLARNLDTTAQDVSNAIIAGEQAGVCRRLKNGRVSFTVYDGLLGVDPPPPVVYEVAVRDSLTVTEPVHPTGRQIVGEFAKQWSVAYRQAYVPKWGPETKLANTIASALTIDDVPLRVKNFLNDSNPFYCDRMHAFSVFVDNINRCGRATARPDVTKTNVPDVVATRRYLEGLKGRSS